MLGLIRTGLGTFAVLLLGWAQSAASERFYTPAWPDDEETQVLFDQPLVLDLARCYGRYQSLEPKTIGEWIDDKTISVSSPHDLQPRQDRIGKMLIAAALRERKEKVDLATLTPMTTDESGQLVGTGAPADIYDAYIRGRRDLLAGFSESNSKVRAQETAELIRSRMPKLMQSCGTFAANAAAGRQLGNAKERTYQTGDDPMLNGQPRMLAVARCYGRLASVSDYLDEVAERDQKARNFYYPDGLAAQIDELAKLLGKLASKDRDEAVNLAPDAARRSSLPFDVTDWIGAGIQDDTGFDFRPDFWSIPSEFAAQQIVEGSKSDRETCALLLKSEQK
jgi:hypothetical protein